MILRHIGKVSYEHQLSYDLAFVHLVYNASLLKKCLWDPKTIVPLEGIKLKDNHSYEEVPIEILDQQVLGKRSYCFCEISFEE